MLEQLTAPASAVGRRGRLRRRFTLVSVGLLSILMAVLGVSFAADAGTSNATVTDQGGLAVYTVGAGATAAPSAAVTLTKGSASADAATIWTGNGVVPAWSAAAGSAGTVTTAGDLAYINATEASATKMMVSLYVTNLNELAAAYSSYNFNFQLYSSANGTTGWSVVDGAQVLTSDSGALNWVVDVTGNKHFGVAMETGGSFYTISTSPASNLTPDFFIRASQL